MIRFAKGYSNNKDKVRTFNLKQYYPKDSLDQYLEYRLKHNPFSSSCDSSLFAMVEDQIVGQILLMDSQLKIKSNVNNCVWGMDYVVTENYRKGPIGVGILKKAIKEVNHIGYGLSAESLKVHLALNIQMISTYHLFLLLNLRGVANLLKGKLFGQKNISLPKKIEVAKVNEFVRAENSYFRLDSFNNYNCIEMTRSKEFIEWRFFFKPGKYMVYINPEERGLTYFVVRPVKFKNLDILLLVDYRFSEINDRCFNDMIRAVKKIVAITEMDGIITSSSLNNFSSFLKRKKFFPYRSGEIVSNFVSSQDVVDFGGIFITLADSDGDFYFSKNPWSYS